MRRPFGLKWWTWHRLTISYAEIQFLLEGRCGTNIWTNGFSSGCGGNNLQKDDMKILDMLWLIRPNWRSLILVRIWLRMKESGSFNLCSLDMLKPCRRSLLHFVTQLNRNFIPYFVDVSKTSSHVGDLKLENCELSCDGVNQLLDALSTVEGPLRSLSVADNFLGRFVCG